jgi:RNA polymerase sigma-70 factor (ECF subfamily)
MIDTIEDHVSRVDRSKVWAACYRVTGCAADADEILQEAFARALETRPAVSDAQPLEPWIMKVAVRLAIDRLRRRKETPYDGPWLPSPVEQEEPEKAPTARYELVESATFAFLLALEALTPEQRAVVVLRDVMDLSVAEAAQVLDASEANVRTLHHRARGRLAAYDVDRVRPTPAVRERAQKVLETFFGHIVSGDTAAAMALLADGATLVNDAGGVYHAARNVVRGADPIVRFYLGLLKKVGVPDDVRFRVLNGLPAVEMVYSRTVSRYAPRVVLSVELDPQGCISAIYMVLAPRKLERVS